MRLGCQPCRDSERKLKNSGGFDLANCRKQKANTQLMASFRSAANSGHNMPPAELPCARHASTKKSQQIPSERLEDSQVLRKKTRQQSSVKHSSSSAWCKVSSYMFAAPGICHQMRCPL